MIAAYLLGLVTIPILAGLFWGSIIAFSKGGHVHCDICGYETPERTILAWFSWGWHQLTIYPQRAHQRGLREWRIKWDRDRRRAHRCRSPLRASSPTVRLRLRGGPNESWRRVRMRIVRRAVHRGHVGATRYRHRRPASISDYRERTVSADEVGVHDPILMQAPGLGRWVECECGWISASYWADSSALAAHRRHVERAGSEQP